MFYPSFYFDPTYILIIIGVIICSIYRCVQRRKEGTLYFSKDIESVKWRISRSVDQWKTIV